MFKGQLDRCKLDLPDNVTLSKHLVYVYRPDNVVKVAQRSGQCAGQRTGQRAGQRFGRSSFRLKIII